MKIKTISIFVVFLWMNVAATNAAVIIEFWEVGDDVVAKTTGSIRVPTSPPYHSGSVFGSEADSFSLDYYNGGFSWWSGGNATSSGLFLNPTSGSGDTFGYFHEYLALPTGLTPGSSFTPDTTWTWRSQTLDGIGLSHLTTTPFTVFERDGQTIDFVLSAVPEPSPHIFIVVGFAATYILRRKTRNNVEQGAAAKKVS